MGYTAMYMKRTNSRGFTLIELLVVIAIIGILASIVLVSLNSARAKGRDAKRVAELGQLARAVMLHNSADTVTAFTCTLVSGSGRASTCTNPSLLSFLDPSGSTTACGAGVALSAACDYVVSGASSFTVAPTFNNWQFKTYLEAGSGTGELATAGVACVSSATSSPFRTGCR